jgi:glycogen operon protein
VNFTLPEVPEGRQWVRLLDTNDPALQRAHYRFGAVYEVTGRSVLLFLLERDGAAQPPPPQRKAAPRKTPRK